MIDQNDITHSTEYSVSEAYRLAVHGGGIEHGPICVDGETNVYVRDMAPEFIEQLLVLMRDKGKDKMLTIRLDWVHTTQSGRQTDCNMTLYGARAPEDDEA